MLDYIADINYLLAVGTIGLQVGAVALFIVLKKADFTELRNFVGRFALLKVFLLSIAGIILTLVYSEVFGFTPCGLCWFERIALYPIALLSGMALWKHDKNIADYILGLSFVGGVIALYHHYLQMGGSPFIVCPTAAPGVECAERIVFEFGYITFPLMAVSLFAMIAVLMLFIRRQQEH